MEKNNISKGDMPSTSKEAEEVYDSDGSADSSDVDKCPICLLAFTSEQEIGKPAVCDHVFCFPCIQEWSKVVQTCPIDRAEFKEIRVYGSLECDHLLRTVAVKEKIALNEFVNGEEVTACEICENTDREDCMLLCDGCDKGFHLDCLDPPLLEIPQGNWYCDDCFETSDESDDDTDELEDLNNDIEEEMDMVQLAETRLRARQPQPQILRTMQSERIRNAILARMSLRSARAAFGEGPSTSAPVVSRAKPVRKRRTTRRRKVKRRARTEVVEYDVDGSDKFAMRTRRVARKSRRKKRKVAKTSKRKVSKPSAGSSTGFKSSNPNVHELQRGRQRAGLSNFNIFQPTNELDYVPDEYENIEDSGIEESAENSSGSVLTQAIIGLRNPQRRNMIIKNRVLQNCTTTSSVDNLLDTIMQDQNLFGPGSIGNKFAVEKSSGKLLFVGKNAVKVKQSSGVEETSPSECPPSNEDNNSEAGQTNPSSSTKGNETAAPSEAEANSSPVGRCSNDRDESQNISGDQTNSNTKESPDDKKKKPKKLAIDMFDESSSTQETTDDCPNFSIYDSVDASVDPEGSSSFQMRPNVYDEENVDLVQLSDNEQNHESSEEALPAIVASQPASPDLDPEDELVPERSYTPPIAQKTSDDAPDKDEHERKKKDRDSRRNRKRELERYNVRDRLKERSPVKIKDKFGRNRSRSRSSSRKKQARRRSRSVSKERHRKSKSHERYRKSRSFSRSRSRRRTPSIDHDRKKTKPHKEKQTKVNRRTRSRSLTPRHHKPTTPDRRARSRSKKPKKRKHCDHNKEKPSTLTKEVFTSGQNILVSVNFNNQEEKSAPKRLKNLDQLEPKEIVDITARKKITISSKPVAIIDLARSPFRELTPEYQTNVIELSDSEGEEARERPPPKSPDSTLSSKLYDPFDILNSPPNENVTSSQNSAAQLMLQKQQEKVQEPVKTSVSYNKNVMAMATNSLFFNEENLVSSSSSLLMNDKQIPLLFTSSKLDAHQTDKNISKNETVPMDIAESPYSPGHEYDDAFPNHDDNGGAKSPKGKQAKGVNKGGNIFDELFGSSTPPGLDKAKNSKKGASTDKPVDSNKYLMKMKRQERVIEEVKLVMKPYYSKRTITKEQYKEILRKAVPKICHSKEINPQKIKVLIDSYVKIFKHRKRRPATDESL